MSAVANEELGPKLTFEIADLLRKRRSGKVKPLCSPTEMEFLGNGDEVGQLPEFHAIDGTGGVIYKTSLANPSSVAICSTTANPDGKFSCWVTSPQRTPVPMVLTRSRQRGSPRSPWRSRR